MITVRVSPDDFDAGKEMAALSDLGGGAVASFIGQVRGNGDIAALELEHYPAMTENILHEIAATADKRWPLHGITIVHKVGKLDLGAQIVLVCTCSDHRQAALQSCSYIMDRLKTDAPFWKKQWRADGSCDWVEARRSDISATEKWNSE